MVYGFVYVSRSSLKLRQLLVDVNLVMVYLLSNHILPSVLSLAFCVISLLFFLNVGRCMFTGYCPADTL
jgi:hypothetical protein